MLYVRQAKGTVDDVVEKLTVAVAAHQLRVLGIHDLKEKMISKGVAFGPQCRIFKVCNPA